MTFKKFKQQLSHFYKSCISRDVQEWEHEDLELLSEYRGLPIFVTPRYTEEGWLIPFEVDVYIATDKTDEAALMLIRDEDAREGILNEVNSNLRQFEDAAWDLEFRLKGGAVVASAVLVDASAAAA